MLKLHHFLLVLHLIPSFIAAEATSQPNFSNQCSINTSKSILNVSPHEKGCGQQCDERGPTGPTGREGPRGRRGHTGPAGPDGATGAEGLQGIQGPTGPTGFTGPTGNTGPSGASGLVAYALFEKRATGPVAPSSPITFDYISPNNTSNIVEDPTTGTFTIGVAGVYLINYIITPIADSTTRFAAGLVSSSASFVPESFYKIEPDTTNANIPVLAGQFITYLNSGTTATLNNLSTTDSMTFSNDIGFSSIGLVANVASITFAKLD